MHNIHARPLTAAVLSNKIPISWVVNISSLKNTTPASIKRSYGILTPTFLGSSPATYRTLLQIGGKFEILQEHRQVNNGLNAALLRPSRRYHDGLHGVLHNWALFVLSCNNSKGGG